MSLRAASTARSPIASTLLKARTEAGSATGNGDVRTVVESVIADVRERGDAAVREYSAKFDKWAPSEFLLTPEQIAEVIARVPQQIIDDIRFVQDQVRTMAHAPARIARASSNWRRSRVSPWDRRTSRSQRPARTSPAAATPCSPPRT